MSTTQKKIRNWSEYNKSLVKRGQLLLSFDTDYLDQLYYHAPRSKGGQVIYSAHMYEFLLNIKVLLRLPWRATTGFAHALLQKAFPNVMVQVPDYSHASRACKALELRIKPIHLNSKEGLNIAFDSTGVNVYSTSGYHQRKYGKEGLYRNGEQWKKVHLAIDLDSLQIVSMAYTESSVNDCEVVDELWDAISRPINSVRADGAYDTFDVYERGHCEGAQIIIPPAVTSKAQDELKKPPKIKKEYLESRDTAIHFIRQFETFEKGLKQWKIESNYHLRSLVETTMFRLKRIFGFHLSLKSEQGRRNELIAKINFLNQMAGLGLPQY
jgi:transposase